MHHRLARLERCAREELAPRLRFRSREPDHQRDARRMRGDHRKDALRHFVATRDPAEDVDQHASDTRVRKDDLERAAHDLFLGAAADVEEVRGAAAGELHRVQRAHHQPGAVPDDADVSVELDVAEAERARFLLGLFVSRDLFELRKLRLPVERVVVHVELRVARQEGPVFLNEERVDLDERGIRLHVDGEELARDVRDRVALRLGNAGLERERARLERQQPEQRARPPARDLVRIGRRDLLDVHPSDG